MQVCLHACVLSLCSLSSYVHWACGPCTADAGLLCTQWAVGCPRGEGTDTLGSLHIQGLPSSWTSVGSCGTTHTLMQEEQGKENCRELFWRPMLNAGNSFSHYHLVPESPDSPFRKRQSCLDQKIISWALSGGFKYTFILRCSTVLCSVNTS
jgi:hypothetical protein